MAIQNQIFRFIIDASAGGAVKELKQFNGQVQQNAVAGQKAATASTAALTKMKVAAAGIGAAAVLGMGKHAVGAARDLTESVNAVNVMYGEGSDAVLEMGDSAAESVGLSKRAFNEAAVAVGGFVENISSINGQSTAQVFDDLITRAADFGSVFNIDVDEALQRFRSGLAGETEPLRRFGINLLQSEVNAYAFAEGIAEVGTTLTEEQKVLARYELLMQKTDKMSGDFANTSGELANQQRILRAEAENLSAEFGEALIPAATAAVGVLSDLIQVMQDFKIPGAFKEISELMFGAGNAADVAAGSLKQAFDPDNLNSQAVIDALTDMTRGVEDEMGLLHQLDAQIFGGLFGDDPWWIHNLEAGMTTLTETAPEMALAVAMGFKKIADAAAEGDLVSQRILTDYGLSIDEGSEWARTLLTIAGAYDHVGSAAGRHANHVGGARRETDDHVSAMERLNAQGEEYVSWLRAQGLAHQEGAEAGQEAIDAMHALAEVQIADWENLGAVYDEWVAGMDAAFGNAASIVNDFSDDAMSDISMFNDELQANTAAAANWQGNLLTIAAATSSGYAAYLAEFGLAGAGMVQDIVDTEGEMQRGYWLWTDATMVTTRDMTGMMENMTDEITGIIEGMGGDVDWDTLQNTMLSNGITIGEYLGDGVAAGITAATYAVETAAANVVLAALSIMEDIAWIDSPSKLFFTRIGVPIAEGVADGIESAADKIADALVESLQDAENSAVKAAEDLISATVDAAWAAIDDPRDEEAARERVSDTETSLMKARDDLVGLESDLFGLQSITDDEDPVETASKIADAIERIADAKERISDLETSLEDANLRLFKQLVDAGRDPAMLGGLAAAAGLSGSQLSGLSSALRMTPIDTSSYYDDMRYVGFTDAQLGDLGAGRGIPDFFGGLSPSEYLATQTFNVTVNAGMGADAVNIGEIVVDAIKRYERLNGDGWRS